MTYVLYAIGEIILVVVGILIAVSLDNMNESRKERLVQIEYLKNLKSDLIADSLNIVSIETIARANTQAIEKYESFVTKGDWVLQEVVDSASSVDLNFHLYFPNTTTFDEMKSAGDLRLLRPEIKRKLNEMRLTQDLLALATENLVKRSDQLKVEELRFSNANTITKNLNERLGAVPSEGYLREALKYRHAIFTNYKQNDQMVRLCGSEIINMASEITSLIDSEIYNISKSN